MNFQDQQKMNLQARLKLLREKLVHVPQKPGVYLHKGSNGEILYVGKAKNLNLRLRSYFTGLERHTPKTRALVSKVYDFDIIVTENEYESLLLENNLIKHNQPNYNILLRDDKSYPYIKIDINEEWPRVVTTRKRKKDGNLYFGPYSLAGQAGQLMNIINRFFPLVKCTPMVFKAVTRPCNYYDIKRCLGPCKLPVNKEEYREHLNSVIAILNANYKGISKKIKNEMLNAASNFDFEKAALFRDQLKALASLSNNQAVTLDAEIEVDIIGSYWNEELIAFYVTNVRDGKIVGGSSHIVKHLTEEPLEEGEIDNNKFEQERVFSAFICQYYQNKSVPSAILFETEKVVFQFHNVQVLNAFLTEKRNSEIDCTNKDKQSSLFYIKREEYLKIQKKKGNELGKKIKDLILLCKQNAENKFQEQTKMDENSNSMMSSLKEFLSLESLPSIIECFDISTFQGAETVASQVVFKNAKPLKSAYKKYIIKDITGHSDDFASLREVIRRRFKDRENSKLPDLIIIDGGTPQVREVGWILKSLGLVTLPIVGIAKARTQKDFTSSEIINTFERIVVPKRNQENEILPEAEPETKILKQGSPEYRLVTQMRDEAHRFAITFHRQRREKSGMKSVLLEIKGLGVKRRKKLIEVYPDLKLLLSESLIVISEKTGIPVNIMQKIIEKIKSI